jgi:hypothetical protein
MTAPLQILDDGQLNKFKKRFADLEDLSVVPVLQAGKAEDPDEKKAAPAACRLDRRCLWLQRGWKAAGGGCWVRKKEGQLKAAHVHAPTTCPPLHALLRPAAKKGKKK